MLHHVAHSALYNFFSSILKDKPAQSTDHVKKFST